MPDDDFPTQPFSAAFARSRDALPPQWRALPPPPRRRTALGVSIGILCAIALAAAGGFALTRGQIGLGFLQAPTAGAGTTKPAPTTTASPVPTAAPTTAGLAPMPTPGPGFQTFTAPDGVWACNAPSAALVGSTSLTIQGIAVPATAFTLGQGAAVTVYELPATVANTPMQELFDELVTASGATDVTILEQPALTVIGANTWQRVTIAAMRNGQPIAAVVYFAQHGTSALAISASAPASLFPDDDQQVFGPLIQSFTFRFPGA